MAATVSSDPSASNGFFSAIESVLGGFAEGIKQGAEFTGQQILPRFFSQELLNQEFDQLRNPTFIPAFAPSRVDRIQPTPVAFGLTQGNLLIGAAAIFAIILVMRK